MNIKLFPSELNIMQILWKHGDQTAAQIAKILKAQVGWQRNTTYTIIGKLADKGAIKREEPNYLCKALISQEQVRKAEVTGLIETLFDGSAEVFLSAFLSDKNLPAEEIDRLNRIVSGQNEIDKLKKIVENNK